MKNLNDSGTRIKNADTCKEVVDALWSEDGIDLEEALELVTARWPKRWHEVTVETVRALIGHVIVEEVVSILDFVDLSVRAMLGELDRFGEEWLARYEARQRAEAKQAATVSGTQSAPARLLTDREIDRLVRLHPGRWDARTIAETRSEVARGHLNANDLELELDLMSDNLADLDAQDAPLAAGGARVIGPILVGTPTLEQRLTRFDGGYLYTNEKAITRAVLDGLDEFAGSPMPAARALMRRVCKPSEREVAALRADAETLIAHFAERTWAAPIHAALKEALRHDDHAVLTLAVIHAFRVNVIQDLEEVMSRGIMDALDEYVKPARKPRKKPAKKTAKRAPKGKK